MDVLRAECPKCKSLLRIDVATIGKTKRCPKCQELIKINSAEAKKTEVRPEQTKVKTPIDKKLILGGIALVVLFVLFPLTILFSEPDKNYYIPPEGRTWSEHVDTQWQRNTVVFRAKKLTGQYLRDSVAATYADEKIQLLNPIRDDEIAYRVLGTIHLPSPLGIKTTEPYHWSVSFNYTRGKNHEPVEHLKAIVIDHKIVYMDEEVKKAFAEFDDAVRKSNQ